MLVVLLLFASATVACNDPVASARRDSLGGEQAGVPRGPTHRPGQPCTWCHDGSYEFELSLAGTVFATPTGDKPVEGARVTITDASGRVITLVSNCAGNFFVGPDTFRPTFPLRASISFGSETRAMQTLIYRETACSACHQPTVGSSSLGRVYLRTEDVGAPLPGGCR